MEAVNYMNDQMSIFDFLPEETEVKDFTRMTIEETAAYIGNRIGMTFHYNNFLEVYEAKYKKLKLRIRYSNYETGDERDGRLFIGCHYLTNIEGLGGPFDSLEESISFFKKGIERYKKGDMV